MSNAMRRHLPWQLWAVAFAIAIPNALLLVDSVTFVVVWPGDVFDWWLIEQAYARVGTGRMFDWSAAHYVEDSFEYVYRYSPLLPPVMGPFVEAGINAWRLAHFAALVALPAPIALVSLLSGPFWFDVAYANFLTFAVVFAWNAVAGRPWAQGAYFILLVLIPRPIAFAVLTGGLALTLATGELFNWITAVSNGSDVIGTKFDWGPSRFLGLWWWPVGLLVGAWLTFRGHLGFASLVVSPYILPYYLLFALLELRHTRLGRGPVVAAWFRDRIRARHTADPSVT